MKVALIRRFLLLNVKTLKTLGGVGGLRQRPGLTGRRQDGIRSN
jgi:hypothetical protein